MPSRQHMFLLFMVTALAMALVPAADASVSPLRPEVSAALAELRDGAQHHAVGHAALEHSEALAVAGRGGASSRLGHVDGAQAQLLRHLATISSNRWLVLKCLGVLLAFALFFIFVVA